MVKRMMITALAGSNVAQTQSQNNGRENVLSKYYLPHSFHFMCLPLTGLPEKSQKSMCDEKWLTKFSTRLISAKKGTYAQTDTVI